MLLDDNASVKSVTKTDRYIAYSFTRYTSVPGEIFFWTRFENLVSKRRKINDGVVPILVAYVIGMT